MTSPRMARDAARRRLSSDAARRAFDAVVDAVEHAAGLRDRQELLRALEDGGVLPARDDINEANFVAPHRDPRTYSYAQSASNPGLRPPDSDVSNKQREGMRPTYRGSMDEGEENSSIRVQLFRDLEDGSPKAWRFMRERLSDADFDQLRRIVYAHPDVDRPPASDEPVDFGGTPRTGGGMTSPLAHDSAAHLPDSVWRALVAAWHVRVDDNVGLTEGPTRRARIAGVTWDDRDELRFERMFPNVRVRLG